VNPAAILDQVLAEALAAVEPGRAVRSALRREAGSLVAGDHSYPLGDVRRLIVVGAGKASAPMAAALEQLLEAREQTPTVEGIVVVRHGHAVPTHRVRIMEAGHPIPDQAGVDAARAIEALVADADEQDLVICLTSGGGSALLTLPVEGVSLADLQATTDALLRSGATINEINALRKHLERLKGGGLARLAGPARLLTLALSDVVGDALDAIASGPTVPDTTTWRDAAAVLDRYSLWEDVPRAVADRVRAGGSGYLPETPKADDSVFQHTHTLVVGSNRDACRAAAAEAERLGLGSQVLSTFVEGEARTVGTVLAAILREVDASGQPLPRPCCIVAGGETTVTVRGCGRGGRNQELALAAAQPLRGVPRVLLASVGTDGSDGPTDAAGAWVDGTTFDRAAALGLDVDRHLADNDAYPLLERLGGLIRTGPTLTNVNDVMLLLAF
jgi:glycerate 2-kinase